MKFRFRVWETNSNQMSYWPNGADQKSPYLIDQDGRLWGWLNGELESWYDKDVVMLSTGLRDRRDREIFEGDVVENLSGRWAQVVWFATPSYVGWDLLSVNAVGKPPDLMRPWGCWTVIGNIYESPELADERHG